MHDPTSTTVSVGLDVHKSSIRLAAVRADELLDERTIPYDHDAVQRLVSRWPGARCCYEAGPTGFGLYRHLSEVGIACEVIAPGLVPSRPGERFKTDPRDARKLARLHAGGLLEAIHVPSPEVEAARDLVRAREDARLDRMRDRHRLSKFLLRHGHVLHVDDADHFVGVGVPSLAQLLELAHDRLLPKYGPGSGQPSAIR